MKNFTPALMLLMVLIFSSGGTGATVAHAAAPLRASMINSFAMKSSDATITPVPADEPAGNDLGLPGQAQCWNCAPFQAKVHLSSYDPQAGAINCWDYDEARHYCYSPTFYGIPWKSLWGFGAACPPDWPIGTWVDIPTVGRFICFDRGGEITCKDGLCNVDILGPSGASWDQQTFQVVLWVPLNPPRETVR